MKPSRVVPTYPAPLGTAESDGNPGRPERPERPGLKTKGEVGKKHDAGELRAWLRALPPLDPVCGPTIEDEERAAIEAEARGEFGPAEPEAEHRADVAALLRGYEAHRDRLSRPARSPDEHARYGAEA